MYGIIKKAALLMLIVSMQAIALNDSEEMEFVGAVNDGDIKIVQRYVETMNVNLEDSYFAWTPFLMTAAKNQLEQIQANKDEAIAKIKLIKSQTKESDEEEVDES